MHTSIITSFLCDSAVKIGFDFVLNTNDSVYFVNFVVNGVFLCSGAFLFDIQVGCGYYPAFK
jgi:hypothetical protein